MSATQPQSANITVDAKSLLKMQGYSRSINLKSLKKTTSFISGLHESKFSGRGMDYQESRIYQPGDDIRNMDWRVTARTGTAHTKLYQEERERPVYIILDTNRSMLFGTRQQFKSVLAAKIASLFAWATCKQGDRVGMMTFGSDGIHSQKARAGQRGVLAIISHILKHTPNLQSEQPNAENLDQCLKQLRSVIRPGSLIIIVSDFYHLGKDCKRHLTQLAKHNDIFATLTYDPFEFQQPSASLYGVVNQNGQQLVDARNRNTQKYISEVREKHVQAVVSEVVQANISVIPVATNSDLTTTLKQGLEQPGLQLRHWLNQINA